jgi:LytR cell envelope-related transcriptional attenuator
MSMLTPPGVGGRRKVRRRGSSRHQGRTIVVLLIVVTAIAAGLAWWLQDDTKTTTTTATVVTKRPSCPPRQSAPAVVAAHDVHVNVYNATKRHGLASEVATQLRQRGFVIGKVENDPAGHTVTGIAEVRATASDAAPARTVGAQVASYVVVPDQRKDASVDLVLGAAFRSLRTTSAASAAMSPTPSPRPSGC